MPLMREHIYFVYIMASASRVLYTGMTSELRSRVWKHKTHEYEGFTDDYNVVRLVWYQQFDDVRNAINREKQIKNWRREKKINLIESVNLDWKDLSDGWYDDLKQFGMTPE